MATVETDAPLARPHDEELDVLLAGPGLHRLEHKTAQAEAANAGLVYTLVK